jgi:hypothetical protein
MINVKEGIMLADFTLPATRSRTPRALSLLALLFAFLVSLALVKGTPDYQGAAVNAAAHTQLTATPTPACGPVWSFLPDFPQSDNFHKLAVAGVDDVWAVGDANNRSVTAHWNGYQWTTFPGATLGDSDYLRGVAARPGEVWSVGYYFTGISSNPLIERWNGSQWSIVAAPTPGGGTYLQDVAVAGSNDVWAVGGFSNTNGSTTRAMILHWDGAQWTEIPNPVTIQSSLDSISVRAPNEIWAVGYQIVGGGHQMLIEHWDGTQWSVAQAPPSGQATRLRSVSAVSGREVWAVGEYPGNTYRTLTVHWDGQQWSIVPSPNPSATNNQLSGVTAISPSDTWAVGTYQYSATTGEERTLIEHWNGAQWSVVGSPNASGAGNFLLDAGAASANYVVALGYRFGWGSWSAQHAGLCATFTSTSTVTPTQPTSTPTDTPTITDSPTSTSTATNTATSTSTPTITHTPTSTFTSTHTPTATLTSVRPPCWAYVTGATTSCSSPTTFQYTFTFSLGTRSPFGTLTIYMDVAADPAGPWTTIDQHTETLSGTVSGQFVEPNIRPGYAWYKIRLSFSGFCPPNPYWFQGEALPVNVCFPSVVTPVPTFTSTPTYTPIWTPSGTVTPLASPTVTLTPSATPTPRCLGGRFSDVCPGDYFYQAVMYLSDRGIVSGYADGTFRPYNFTTRGQLCKIVVLGEGWTIDTTGGPHFSDVPTTNPFYFYIETAYNHDVISGYADGTFRWGNNVTRAQLCKIVVLGEEWTIDTSGGPHFTDVPVSDPFYGYIETAYNHNIITGYADATFKPGNNATRGQIAKIVYSAITQP